MELVLRSMVILLSAVQVAFARGVAPVVNLFEQEEGDDIISIRRAKGKMLNALPRNSHLKWLKSNDGKVYIPYKFASDTGYNSEEVQNVTEAMNRIKSNTCVNFVPWNGEQDYIEIQNRHEHGCYTDVGRTQGREILQLESSPHGTCMHVYLVLHELMHITGLWHEHMRNDRDEYVTIHYENIKPERWSQFEKITPIQGTTYNVPYDYTSLMHYKKTAFSKMGNIAMETKDPSYQDIIGTQHDASPNDYRKICEIYECDECNAGKSGDNSNNIVSPNSRINPTNDQVCRDHSAFYCKQLEVYNTIDCYQRDADICCATCKRLREGNGQWDYRSNYRY